jgi:hypothetical protein
LRKALLPYGVSTLDPVIEITDTSLVKGKIKLNVEKRIVARLAELEREYNLMVDLFDINKTVLKSEFSFEPKQNQIYHLYEREDGSSFLSLIEPHQWDKYLLVSVRLSSDGIWENIKKENKTIGAE